MSPDPNVLDAFTQTVSWSAMTAAWAGLAVGGVGFAGLMIPAFNRALLPQPRETRLADSLPFDRVLPGGRTIVCRNGTYVRCIEVHGVDMTFLSQEEQQRLYMIRKQWLDAIASSGMVVRIFTLREKFSVELDSVVPDNQVLSVVAEEWNQKFKETYRNRQVIVLSIKGANKSALEKLDEATEVSQSILYEYSPVVLNQNHSNPRYRVLPFWAKITSPLSKPEPGGTGHGVSDAITADIAEFDRGGFGQLLGGVGAKIRSRFSERGIFKFTSGEKEKFGMCISLRALADYTSTYFVQDLATLKGESVICHVVEPINRVKAALEVEHQSRLTLASRLSLSTASQFDEAMDMIEGNDEKASTLCNYSLMLFLYSDSIEELDEMEKSAKRIASTHGYTPVREGVAAQASWFAQFPSYPIWPRIYKLFSSNVATHIVMDRQSEGIKKSDWGDGPIAMFKTMHGTPYSFQFHVSDEPAAVAHAVTIGPTGSGKTTLINFLTGMAMRHGRLRCYMIDRHGGGYIFTRAAGGQYITFDGSDFKGTTSALNPFQCEDSVANRSFLRAFLQALGDISDDDSAAIEEIGFAVKAAFDEPGLPKELRSLTNLYDAAFSKSGTLRKKLHKWVDPAVHGNVFNAAQDTLDLSTNRLNSFDFTRIYEHDDLARAVILYLMHRIQTTISELRSPALIFIDETEPVVQHPLFRKFYLQMLQEYRKRGAAVISAFQRPEAIAQAGLGEAIRGQAQTTFFFPNPQARYEEYADWGLTEREWGFIKGRLPISVHLRRAVLVKRATGESVILDTDLSSLGPLLKIYMSDQQSLRLADEMMLRHGDDWLYHYVNTERAG